MKTVLERFLEYIKFDTQSKEESERIPSTSSQKVLAKYLFDELKEMGASNVRFDDYGYVYATIPSNLKKARPSIGFIAHMDTSPALSGKNVNARVVENYNGQDIVLNKEEDYVLRTKEYPSLLKYKGKDLVVTDGTTLLGADNKAGIAQIMTMAEILLKNPQIKHTKIQIGFTPDEEIGRGADHFNIEGFDADFAYTVDGGELGELEYENFNAAGAKVIIQGTSIHPGTAKGKMKNALLLAMEFQNMLPVEQNPMYTEGYEGFFMLDSLNGNVDSSVSSYIIRDHDKDKFQEKKSTFLKIASYLNDKYGQDVFKVDMEDSYYNMKEKIEPHMHLIENAKKAMEEVGIVPKIEAIRGGTDGARLSYMGLPCPNLCTGGYNFHGRYEYIPVQSMEKVVDLLLKIIEIYSTFTK